MTDKNSQVNRYDLVSGHMQKWPRGEFVYYSDYAEVLAERDLDKALIAEQAKHIAELEVALNLASASYAGERERADALQARTVKLPEPIGPEAAPAHYWDNGESMAYADGYNKATSDSKNLCAAAGITLDVGE